MNNFEESKKELKRIIDTILPRINHVRIRTLTSDQKNKIDEQIDYIIDINSLNYDSPIYINFVDDLKHYIPVPLYEDFFSQYNELVERNTVSNNLTHSETQSKLCKAGRTLERIREYL